MISEVHPGLYFYWFGDVEEIGKRNFLIRNDLKSVVHMLLREWGPATSLWEALRRNADPRGYPGGYDQAQWLI